MSFGFSSDSEDFRDYGWYNSPNNQLGDPLLYPSSDDFHIAPTELDFSNNLMAPDTQSDYIEKELEEESGTPTVPMNCQASFQNQSRPSSTRRVTTRCHLKLPKRIPPPPPCFKQSNPPFLGSKVEHYPFDSLYDCKTFLAHNNSNPANTWVCLPVNFVNRLRNDRFNEQKVYGYIINNT